MRNIIYLLFVTILFSSCSKEEGVLNLKIVSEEAIDNDGKFPPYFLHLIKVFETESGEYEFQPKIQVMRLDVKGNAFDFLIPNEPASWLKKKLNFYTIKEYQADYEYLKNDKNFEIPNEGYIYLTQISDQEIQRYDSSKDEKIFYVTKDNYIGLIDSFNKYINPEIENNFTIYVRTSSIDIDTFKKDTDIADIKETPPVKPEIIVKPVEKTIVKVVGTPLPDNWKNQTLGNQLNYITERGYGNNRETVANFLKRNKFTSTCRVTRLDNNTEMSIDEFLEKLRLLQNEKINRIGNEEYSDGKISSFTVDIQKFGN